MNTTNENLTAEQAAALKAAEEEAHFGAESLIQEIAPLIKSYFIAETAIDGNVLTIGFKNGQKFRLTAKEA